MRIVIYCNRIDMESSTASESPDIVSLESDSSWGIEGDSEANASCGGSENEEMEL